MFHRLKDAFLPFLKNPAIEAFAKDTAYFYRAAFCPCIKSPTANTL